MIIKLFIFIFILLGVVGIGMSVQGIISSKNKDTAIVRTEENYKTFTENENTNKCQTPEDYTDDEWRSHMSHHPDRYQECLTNIKPNYMNIDPVSLNNILSDQNMFLLDVHIPEQKHIPGTDALIPFDSIAYNISKLPQDKNTKIVVYCKSGNMSQTASKKLVEMGYKNVYNLEGGLIKWIDQGFEAANYRL